MSELIYCATPSRLSQYTDMIMDFVSERSHAPFHPFKAFPFDRFEGNPAVGRDLSMEYCARAVEMCDQFWMFGVSEGTLTEIRKAIGSKKPMEVHLEDWKPGDTDWREHYDTLRQQFGNPLDGLQIN